MTGVEIHPGAKIGSGVMIDHGMGIVIGETAEVGDGCTIYQGVTLGGTGKDKGKRHPTLGKNVTVGCGAKILGPFKVGDGAKVAANAVLLESIPAQSTAVGVPARVARVGGRKPTTLDHVHIPTLWRRRSAACALKSVRWSSASGNWKRRSKNKRRSLSIRRGQPRRMSGKTRTGPAPRVHTARGMGLTACGRDAAEIPGLAG